MVNTTIKVIDRTNLVAKHKSIIAAAERGVKLATEESVQWVKIDVVQGQKYVGDGNYPDVKPSTKRWKAKKGAELVGRLTGNWVASFNSSVKGLVGTIRGGGAKYGKFQLRWRVGDLFMAHRAKRTREIIEGAIKKKI
jgi:hypothetical protein